jgi:ATP-dependent exoDNAse (exonuclease V) beta subunit
VQVGTVIHRELYHLARKAADAGAPVPPAIERSRYRRELALLGVEEPDLEEAAGRVQEALTRVWDDPTGRWILAPHPEAWSEQRLTVRFGTALEHIRLDRSFVDEAGQRWIIDYKTGRHLGADIDAFLATEIDRYRGQLERYAQAVAAFERRPLRVGLYFPLLARLLDWAPALNGRNQSVPV